MKKKKSTPGASRFRQLIERALFELRLAADVARAEGFDSETMALVEGSKRNLRACLARIEGKRKEAA